MRCFPLARDENDQWYVRQWGYKEEDWNLFCLHPEARTPAAGTTLQEEIELARMYTEQEQEVV